MPLREKMTRSRSAVPRGNPSVGREECAIGTVMDMDGGGAKPSGLFMWISCGFWVLPFCLLC
jgi:hypothetical protein